MYRIANLTKKFGGKVILNSVSLSVESHQTTVVIGPSGSGKTTFLRCMNLLEIPDRGRLNLEGTTLDFDGGPVPQKEILNSASGPEWFFKVLICFRTERLWKISWKGRAPF